MSSAGKSSSNWSELSDGSSSISFELDESDPHCPFVTTDAVVTPVAAIAVEDDAGETGGLRRASSVGLLSGQLEDVELRNDSPTSECQMRRK